MTSLEYVNLNLTNDRDCERLQHFEDAFRRNICNATTDGASPSMREVYDAYLNALAEA